MTRRTQPLALLAVALAACGTAPATLESPAVTSPRPSQTRAETPAPTSTPTLAPAAGTASPEPVRALGRDVLAEVVTTDLILRSGPGVSPESLIVGELAPGQRLYLVDGPVAADGYDWFLASRVEGHGYPYPVFAPLGWVAGADTTGEQWIGPIEPDCPSEASVDVLDDLDPVLRLACFGAGGLSIDGDVTCPIFGAPVPTPAPAWLTWGYCLVTPPGVPPYNQLSGGPPYGMLIHYPPGAERFEGALRISGHFDDPQANACTYDIPTPSGDVYGQELAHRAQQLACRASFVVDIAGPRDN